MKLYRYIETFFYYRKLILLIVGILTSIFLYFSMRVTFDNSIEIWFLKDDESLQTYMGFLDRFGADEVIILAMLADNIFRPDMLATLDKVTRAVEEASPFIYRVRSLTNIRIAASSNEVIHIGPLIEKLPETQTEADIIREQALNNTILVKNLFSKDCKATAIIIELDPKGNNIASKIEVSSNLRKICQKYASEDIQLLLAGSPIFDDAFFRYNQRDFVIFGPVTLLFVLITCFLVFRRLSSTVIPLAVVILALIWTFGTMGIFNIKLNAISITMLAIILAVGVANTIHILADYYQQLMSGKTPNQAVRSSISNLFIPCLFTSMTTCAGMLSLTISALKPMREFAVFSAYAVALAFIFSFTVVPLVLHLSRPPNTAFVARQQKGLISRILRLLGAPSKKSSVCVVLIMLLLFPLAIWQLRYLDVGSNPIGYFKEDEPLIKDLKTIDNALGGSTTAELLVKAPNEGLKEPKILKRLDNLERWLEEQNGVSSVFSIVDTLKELHRVFNEDAEPPFAIPESRSLIAQYYLLLEGEDDFNSIVQDNYSVGRITGRVNLSIADILSDQIPEINTTIQEQYNSKDLTVQLTGFIVLMAKMETYLLDSQIRSLICAFTVITLMMLILLRSWRLALFSMIPNIIPIFMGLSFMTSIDIDLDPGTVMIGSIVMGLVVDDTVHFLVRLKRQLNSGANIEHGIANTMWDTGRPIIVTSILLAAGFSVLLFGSFQPDVNFGLISSFIIIFALLADLVLLPAALKLLRPKIVL